MHLLWKETEVVTTSDRFQVGYRAGSVACSSKSSALSWISFPGSDLISLPSVEIVTGLTTKLAAHMRNAIVKRLIHPSILSLGSYRHSSFILINVFYGIFSLSNFMILVLISTFEQSKNPNDRRANVDRRRFVTNNFFPLYAVINWW